MAKKDELDLDVEPVKPKGRGRLWLILSMALLLGAGATAGVLYFLLGGDDRAAEAGPELPVPPIYKEIQPAIVVNFQGPGRIRYVQVGVVISSRDQQAIDALDRHMPVIRNNLIMLFSGKDYEVLNSPEGKEQARQEVLETVRQVLRDRAGGADIDSVYFTSFVMQ